jgi:hypothetical protein
VERGEQEPTVMWLLEIATQRMKFQLSRFSPFNVQLKAEFLISRNGQVQIFSLDYDLIPLSESFMV